MAPRRTPRKATPGTLIGSSLSPLVAGIDGAERLVCIATPFLTLDVARRLIRATDESGAKQRRLLTALTDASVENGYLSARAVEEFDTAGFEVRSLLNLHAKVVLVDRKWGLIGSGNLTRAGAGGRNAELGIVLNASQARLAQRDHFDVWWDAADPLDFEHLRRIRRKEPANGQRARRKGQGGVFSQPPDPELDSFAATRRDSGYWLKLVYGTGMGPDDLFDYSWISDHDRPKPDGSPGGRRPGYKVGDHIVIYVTRGDDLRCPAVARVTAPPVLDPGRVEREGSKEDAEQWPWLTEIDVVHAVPLRRGATLDQIGVGTTSIRQHDHITLRVDQYRRALDTIQRRARR